MKGKGKRNWAWGAKPAVSLWEGRKCRQPAPRLSPGWRHTTRQSSELEGGGATLLLTYGVLGTGDTAVSEKVRPLPTGTSEARGGGQSLAGHGKCLGFIPSAVGSEKWFCVLVFKCFRIVAKIVQRVLIILFTRVPPVLTSYSIAQSSN